MDGDEEADHLLPDGAQHDADAPPASILYELLVFCEWRQEPCLEVAERLRPASLRQWAAGVWPPSAGGPPEPLAALMRAQPAWQLCLSGDGRLLAVLQHERLEVRAARDNFTSTVATCAVAADALPHQRRLAWGGRPPLLAVADSGGAVRLYDCAAGHLALLQPADGGRQAGAGVVQLVLAPAAAARWDALLLVVRYGGDLTGYHVSASHGCQQAFTFSFKLYGRGITSATWDEQRRLLVVAGQSGQVGSQRLEGLGSCEGITCWRLLAEFPHLQLCQSVQELEVQPAGWWPWRGAQSAWDPVVALSLSPAASRLLSAHLSGALTVWQFPSLRKQSHWPLQCQPGQDAVSPGLLRLPTGRRQRRVRALGAAAGRPADVSWWSEAAVVLARCSGAVTVSHADTLANLLGESAEFFGGAPRVSSGRAAGDGQALLVLECERRSEPARRRVHSDRAGGEHEPTSDDEQDDEEPTVGVARRLLDGFRSAVYWLTDSERFEPTHRQARLTHTLYRLTCLRSTTPQQLYARKIELGQYSEALMLAETYSLDSDMVFLKHWQKTEVCADSIRDLLSRISSRSVVLNECVSVVPARLAVAHQLLEHGLRATQLEAVLAAADPAHLSFHTSDAGDVHPGDRLERLSAAGPLTSAQRQVVRYRRRLLEYRQMLLTYTEILGGQEEAERRYQPAVYGRLRDRSALETALDFARSSQWQALQVMMTYYGHDLLPHRLQLLSNLPETTPPILYAPLLPEMDAAGHVVQWETRRWEEPDWVDSLLLDDTPRHRQQSADCPVYAATCDDLSGEQLTAWYLGRAREVVERTSLVRLGLDLVQLGRERNVAGLETLRDELETLCTLVYDAAHAEMTLDSLASMTPDRLVRLIMSDADEATFVARVRDRLLPFLARRPAAEAARLLHGYVLGLATDGLALPALLVHHSIVGEPRPLLADADQLVRLAVDAVYACGAPQWAAVARRMVSALPAVTGQLLQRRQRLDAQLDAVQLLAAHGHQATAGQVAEVAADPGSVLALLERLSRVAMRPERQQAQPDWRRLLDDMLEMQQKVFQVVTPQACQEVLVLAMLTSGRPADISLAGSLMTTDPAARPAVTNVYLCKLPYPAAVSLAVTAAREYFDASASLVDPSMELARQCLQLIRDPPPEVRVELGLVDSLQYLVEFGVELLPVQVRITANKLTLLKKCLDGRPDAYRSDQELLKLSQLLQVPDSWRLMRLIAERALQAADPATAARVCLQLVDGEHTSVWDVCQQVAECDNYDNIGIRLQLLSFSLAHCPAAQLELLLRLRQRLLAVQLVAQLELCAAARQEHHLSSEPPCEADRHTSCPREDQSDGGQHSSAGWHDPQEATDGRAAAADVDVQHGTRGLTGHIARATATTTRAVLQATSDTTRAVLQATSDTTRAVLQATSDTTRALVSGQLPGELLTSAGTATRSLLRSTVSRLTPGPRAALADLPPANTDVTRLGVPAFSAALLPGCHHSALYADYTSFSAPSTGCPALTAALAAVRLDALRAAAAGRPLRPALVQRLVPLLLREDTALALAWALSLPTSELCRCCHDWPPTELALRLAAYCCALKLAAEPADGAAAGPCWPSDTAPGGEVTLVPPSDLVAASLRRRDPTSAGLREAMLQLERRLQDVRQAGQLLRLDAGVDVARFVAEPAYQRDTIVGLAMSDDDATLETAARLARRYGVPAAQLAVEQMAHLFSAAQLSVDEVRERLSRRQLVHTAMTQPGLLARTLRERVFPTLSGLDHARLLLYHSVLAQADPGDAPSISARVTLLQLVRGTGTDFSQLMAADGDRLALLLRPALTEHTVEPLQELAARLGNPALTGSVVAAAWLVRLLIDEGVDRWQPLLEAELPRLQPLEPADFTGSAVTLLFGDAALKRGLKARQQMAATLRTATLDRKPEDGWTEVRHTMDGWVEHLEYLEWDSYQELLESTDDDIYRFARLFDQSRGEVAWLRALRTKMVVDGCHLSAMRQILSVFPLDEVALVSTVLLDALRESLAQLRSQAAGTFDLRPLTSITAQLRRYIDAGGDHLTSDQVISEFTQLCDDPEVDVGRRVKVARLVAGQLGAARQLLPVLVHADTVAVLPGADVTEAATRDEAGRLALLGGLAVQADSLAAVGRLLQLLSRWPAFSADVCADPARSPLCLLCARALRLDDGEDGRRLVVTAAAEYSGSAALPVPGHGRLVQLLADTAGGAPAALQTALLSDCRDLRLAAVQRAAAAVQTEPERAAAENGGRWPLDHATLDSLVSAGALPLLVGTCLYEPAVSRLLAADADPLPAVAQLRHAGHQPEAVALLLRARAGRPAAATATISAAKHAASKVFSKWLQ